MIVKVSNPIESLCLSVSLSLPICEIVVLGVTCFIVIKCARGESSALRVAEESSFPRKIGTGAPCVTHPPRVRGPSDTREMPGQAGGYGL